MRKLFGTDGIRGLAGEYPLDSVTLFRIGAELGDFLRQPEPGARAVIGRDTRASGTWMQKLLVDGLASAGVKADVADVFTTPGVSFLARTGDYQAGVVISASHNPYRDNGVKIFAGNGMKISDAAEDEIEARVLKRRAATPPDGFDAAPLLERMLAADEEFTRSYQDFLRRAADGSSGRRYRIVVDCANGAAFRIGPAVLRSLGHQVVSIHDRPDGTNINLNSGALHPEELCRTVRSQGADFGVAFDGDADRAIFADEAGDVVDGDHVLYILARHLKDQGKLAHNRIVTTVMANIGLEVALQNAGIAMTRTLVGDRYVMEQMAQSGSNLGGEQSGHILLLDRSVSGDGILTAIELVNVLRASGKELSELASPVKKFPQILLSVSVVRRPDLSEVPTVGNVIDRAARQLGGEGRVVVRYSGTEPIVRVMVEGRREEEIRDLARQIAHVIEAEIG